VGVTLVIVALLAANGFFVAAEFALVKARGFRIEALAQEGSRAARLTMRIQLRIEPYLAACQLGITMASLGLGWVGEPAVEALLRPLLAPLALHEQTMHTIAFLVGFVVFSALHIVVGEQVPKTLAIRRPEPVSVWIAYPLHAFYLLVYPLNIALNGATAAILAVFRVEQATHADLLSDQELRGLITLSQEHGGMEEQKATMLHNLFAFDERLVGRVMIPRGDVVVLEVGAPPADSLAVLRDTQHSRFPVVAGDESRPVGIVLAKDLYAQLLECGEAAWEGLAALCREPLVVPETLRVSTLFDTMRAQRAHMALVVDEYGDLVGLVTLEDLIEEIVGDIADETDAPEPRYSIVEHDGVWEAHGLASLSDVERTTGLVVDDDLDANTLSGLFMQRLGRMPEVGDTLVEGGFEVTVDEMRDNHVERVRLHRPPEHSPAEGGSPKDPEPSA
jgi:CBS domain containing-hemolysin-like protein